MSRSRQFQLFSAFLMAFIGGSLILFCLSVLGCRNSDRVYFYHDPTLGLIGVDSAGRLLAPKNDTLRGAQLTLIVSLETTEITGATLLPAIGNRAHAYKRNLWCTNADKVKSIKIIPLHDFRSYPAGKDIATEFDIDKTINEMNEIRDYLPHEFHIRLDKVDAASWQQFSIEILSENGVLLRATSNKVYCLP